MRSGWGLQTPPSYRVSVGFLGRQMRGTCRPPDGNLRLATLIWSLLSMYLALSLELRFRASAWQASELAAGGRRYRAVQMGSTGPICNLNQTRQLVEQLPPSGLLLALRMRIPIQPPQTWLSCIQSGRLNSFLSTPLQPPPLLSQHPSPGLACNGYEGARSG